MKEIRIDFPVIVEEGRKQILGVHAWYYYGKSFCVSFFITKKSFSVVEESNIQKRSIFITYIK